MSIAIIYGSSMGNTESAANKIQEALGLDAVVLDIGKTDADTINGYDKLILGTSTWGSGDLQDDWDAFDLSSIEFSGKTVAFFGLGDQESYSDEFCDALIKLYEAAKENGANIVGEWDTDGYSFEESQAIVDGKFVGLTLDYDNEEDLTDDRVAKWVELIKPNFA